MMRLLAAAWVLAGVTACGTAGIKADGGSTWAGDAPTWYKNVLPITQSQCANCHTAGGIGSFSLDSYATAKPMAQAMKAAAVEKRMPPWMPSAECGGPFRDERRLTQDEIDTIAAWADLGALEGNVADAPPTATPRGQLAHVDTTVEMTEPYTPNKSIGDDYRCFLIDPKLTSNKQLTGYDITPGNRAVVHHVILYLVNKADAEAADAREAGPGWTCFGSAGIDSSGAVGAWAPGGPAVTFPSGTGISMGAGKVLAMQVHYNTSAGTGPDSTSVKFQYATSNVTDAYLLPLVNADFVIPPNSTEYTSSKNFPNSVGLPIKIWGLLPHMHTKGQRITMTMTGSGTDTCLVDIPKWDFHWQLQYFRPTPYVMTKAESVRLSCTWANPTSNTITWGESTSDEMCFAYVYATL